MDQALVELLAAGDAALRSGQWPEARRHFEDSLALEETPEALFGLGTALWWTNEGADALGLWERAFRGFRRNDDDPMAVATAVQLSLVQLANFGNDAAAAGWAARADRIARGSAALPLRGWGLIAKGSVEEDPTVAERWAREAMDIATTCEDRDLELCALALLGAVLIDAGHPSEGVALLDEAMAGALGEADSLDTVVFTSCVLVVSCYQCADFGRVVQWTADLVGFTEQYGSPYVNAVCRAHYGAVLVATGDWSRADQELAVALELAGRSLPGVRAEALTFLAELRLAQGRLEEAADLLTPVLGQKVAWPTVAAIELARGEAEDAAAGAARKVELVGGQQLPGSRLREVLGDALLESGDVDGAAAVGRELEAIASTVHCDLITARAARLLGRALVAAGETAEGMTRLTTALHCFDHLQMPLEVARTRMTVGRALSGTDRRAALVELRLASGTFEALGAGRDLAAADSILRALDSAPRRTTERFGMAALTSRERMVLSLVAEGLSNPEIAERLYLSRRTVEHHVASVLSKLGLRNRTEAAALVLRG